MYPFPTGLIGQLPAFNAADKAANVVLSNGNATIATSSGGFVADACRSVTSHTAGKWHFEFALTDTQPWAHPQLGIANVSASLTGGLENTVNACVVDVISGSSTVYNNGSLGGNSETFTWPLTVAVEVDLDAKQFWFRRLGGTRTGPFTYGTISGPIFAVAALFTNTQTITLNTGLTAFAITPTSGFNAWG